MIAHAVDTGSSLVAVALQALISVIVYVSLASHDWILEGLALPELLFVAGLLRIAWGIVETLSESLWETGQLAKSGELIYYMLSPVPTLAHLMFCKIQFERLADIVWGVGFLFVAISLDHNLIGDGGILALFYCLMAIIFSAFLFFSVVLFGAAANILWLSESGLLMSASVQVAELGLYPGRLFSKMFGALTVLVIPIFTVGVVGEYLLFGSDKLGRLPDWVYWGALALPASCLAGAYAFWRLAISRYEGTGS